MPGVEIERKFLVEGEAWRKDASARHLRQAYLSTDPDRVVRVRMADDEAWLTIKGRPKGAARAELEYPIPLDDALAMLELAKGAVIEKRRYRIEHEGFVWEVDEFLGLNRGLIVAEIEVEDAGDFDRALAKPPAWLGREVSEDPRFSNAELALRPFTEWTERERHAISTPESGRG
jgi:adenylate cyclase